MNTYSTTFSTGVNQVQLDTFPIFHRQVSRQQQPQVFEMDLVREVLRKYNLEEKYNEYRFIALWPQVVGSQIARLTSVRELRSGQLTVLVSSSSVAQELSLLKARYIARINELAGKKVITNIRFIPGHIPSPPTCIQLVSPPPAYETEARNMFATIDDRRLRHSFERLYTTVRQREDSLIAAGGKRCIRCGVVFFGEGDLCPGCRFDPFADRRSEE